MNQEQLTTSKTTSLRLSEKLDADLEAYVKLEGYASKSEALRQMLRETLYKNLSEMRGALKDEVKPRTQTAGESRRRAWKQALKKAGGDHRKAYELLDSQEEENLAGLRL